MNFTEFLGTCQSMAIRFKLDGEQFKVSAPPGALTPEIVERLRHYKPELMNWLRRTTSVSERKRVVLPITRSNHTGLLSASYGQEQLWLADQMGASGDSFHLAAVLDLKGQLNVTALEASLASLVQRHEALRTVFLEEDGVLFQNVRPATPITLEIHDVSALSESESGAASDKACEELSARPFDLTADSMLRTLLIRMGDRHHRLAIVLHHIASDGWSMGILVKELQALYSRYVADRGVALADLAVQYGDYACWQRDMMQGEQFDLSLGYWKSKLEGTSEVHGLPLDRPRGHAQSFKGQRICRRLAPQAVEGLKQLARQSGSTLFVVLEGLFALMLLRHGRADDIVIGTPVANREREEVEGVIGYFANLVALRHLNDTNASLLDWLKATHDEVMKAFEHGYVPFEKIVQAVAKSRSVSYSPLVQVAFILQNNEVPDLDLPGLSCTTGQLKRTHAQFELQLEASETVHGLELNWDYMSDLFDEDTIGAMADRFECLVASALANPDTPVCRLNMLPAPEMHRLTCAWNATQADYPVGKCVHHLFEMQAEATPENIAVVCGEERLSYSELNRRAGRLAQLLVEKGAGPDALVGICVERSIDMVVGLLAILKSGSAYVPLDPEYPVDRLHYMIEDARLAIVVSQQCWVERGIVPHNAALCLDDPDVRKRLNHATTGVDESFANKNVQPHDLAYVIYTSGSTGKPKGVMVEHRQVANFLRSMQGQPGMSANDCLLAVTSTSFDIHGLEIFLPLIAGANIVVATREDASDADRLAFLIKRHAVTMMQATPATWKMLMAADWRPSTPIKLLCGGEALALSLANELLGAGKVELWNMYGPTETTIWSCCKQILPEQASILMGQPINNTQVYVAQDDSLTLAPVGVPGELLIGGLGVTRGYLNRAELTSEKFIPNPFHRNGDPFSSERLYKTGDLVRWLKSGDLEFLGRIDHQVKIRGFRIELGEIENALHLHADVEDAVVVAQKVAGEQCLVAYVVPVEYCHQAAGSDQRFEEQSAQISSYRNHLQQSLPDYMVPSQFVLMAQFPLTPNGKIDRKALPQPEISRSSEAYIAPRNDVEEKLAHLWREVLAVDRVGVTENFFELGGHSVLAARLTAQIRKLWKIELSLLALFSKPTIESLAAEISASLADSSNGPDTSGSWERLDRNLSRLSSSNDASRSIVLIPGAGGGADVFHKVAPELALRGAAVFVVHHDGVDNDLEPVANVKKNAESYAEQIIQHAHGDLVIAGYCIGGLIGYEVLQALHAKNIPAKEIFLLDTPIFKVAGPAVPPDSYFATMNPSEFNREYHKCDFFMVVCNTYSHGDKIYTLDDFAGIPDEQCIEHAISVMNLTSESEIEYWKGFLRKRCKAEILHHEGIYEYLSSRTTEELLADGDVEPAFKAIPISVLLTDETLGNRSEDLIDLRKFGFQSVRMHKVSGAHRTFLKVASRDVAELLAA